jgi:hypothetical protein
MVYVFFSESTSTDAAALLADEIVGTTIHHDFSAASTEALYQFEKRITKSSASDE